MRVRAARHCKLIRVECQVLEAICMRTHIQETLIHRLQGEEERRGVDIYLA